MNIELQQKNIENPKKEGYEFIKTTENEENKEENNIQDNEIEQRNLQEKTENEEFFDVKNENILQKNYNKIKTPLKKGIKKYLRGIYYIIYAASLHFYILGLDGCKCDNLEECLINDQISNYVFAGINLLISSGIFSFVILIQILMKLTKVNYIIFFTPYIILFRMFTGVDLRNHGTYNTIGFLVAVPVLTLIFYIIYYLFYSIYKKNLLGR